MLKQRSSIPHKVLPFIILILFSGAIWILHDSLQEFHYHHILQQLKSISSSRIAMAIGLTILSYLIMTGYDHLAIRYIKNPIGIAKVTLASFISYAFSNTIGLSLLTSGSIRYRLYSSWGLSAERIARLVAFTVLTFWLGIGTIGSIIFIVEPLSIPILKHFPIHSTRPLGYVLATLVGSYLLIVLFRKTPFHFRNWELRLPSIAVAWTQLLIGSLDWMLAGCVLYVLLPEHIGISFFQFLGIFLLAQVVALISHVPGGLGVFESMILLSAPSIPADMLLGSMLIYRGIYYLLPLTLAALLLGGGELLQKKTQVSKAILFAGQFGRTAIPHLLAATTLTSGAVLLFSGVTPVAPGRLNGIKEVLSLPVIELSHFLSSLIGIGLLLLARGLQRRLDAAYVLAAILLGTSSLLALLKGGNYEESILLGLMLIALLPCRSHFYRKASLFNETFTPGWNVAVLLILGSSIWLGIFTYKHVDYSSQLWWQFTLHGGAPRFLRATVGSVILLLALAIARLLRTTPEDPTEPGPDELIRAKQIISQSPATEANLALLGDKTLLFNEQQNSFIMYGVEGNSWIAMGDPIGPPEEANSLAWSYRELVERHGGQTIFYEVGTHMLPVYLDMGLTLFKLGEQASVPLINFSLEGSERKGLRYIYRRLNKEGSSFEVYPADRTSEILPELRRISDIWLKEKSVREKGFSLGFFDESYLLNFPVAIVRQEEEIVAFANLWMGASQEELSIDLMRYSPEAPRSIMDYLFTNLMLWGKEQGYQSFNLGMAPLSGLENRSFAPLWNRIGSIIFSKGEHFYNFEGLREYKQKYKPVWSPRYLACPGGLALPRILTNVTSLISGGIKGVFIK
ncbi:bifunctional lysylphosphatidylglycerol flippase/synthetase MprF [uncultured Desulfuromusa sp.]|uniref:bifunctional lysylphosphatidylglycerol flippase/synthetase MprF n=1 Tax=uncultured Desulfuromusa sp. TaxID=219183 RepID=UPI002AA7C639|nr:bifunctional lysylphosphatidylglycerol flippase/synthetase MprF [uncultured Desulfuromusa sp.]